MHKIIEILETRCDVEYKAAYLGAPAYLLWIKYNDKVYNAAVYVSSLGSDKKSHRIAKTILNELHRKEAGNEGHYEYIVQLVPTNK